MKSRTKIIASDIDVDALNAGSVTTDGIVLGGEARASWPKFSLYEHTIFLYLSGTSHMFKFSLIRTYSGKLNHISLYFDGAGSCTPRLTAQRIDTSGIPIGFSFIESIDSSGRVIGHNLGIGDSSSLVELTTSFAYSLTNFDDIIDII